MQNVKPQKTYVNDLVLVYKEDIPQFFARVEDISEDIKPGWFHLKLLVLTIPVQEITWILKDVYIDGDEFSMGGQKMRIEKIQAPSAATEKQQEIKEEPKEKKIQPVKKDNAKVISFSSLKK